MRYRRELAPDCPADLFISLYKDGNAPKIATFSKRSFKFFKDNADGIVVHGRHTKFSWEGTEQLPELRLKVEKKR